MNFKEQFTTYLEQLRRVDSEHQLFGSGAHKYAFGLKLSDAEISTFEKENNCTLPESYKTFLSEFGNGGGGPYYGVFPLGMMDGGWKIVPFYDYIKPRASFRYTAAYNNDEMLYEGEPREQDFEEETEFDDAHERWYYEIGEANQDKYYEEHALDGAIPICHHGCGFRSWLVVDEKSPEFGNIWDDLIPDNSGVAPTLNKDGDRMTFADWVLDWCTTSIQKLETPTEK